MGWFDRLTASRTPSSQRTSSTTPIPPNDPRPSSSLENTLPTSQGIQSMYDARPYTPTPGPTKPTHHARTPSMLRSLAHHPSLSALRSKTKKKARGDGRPPLPVLNLGDVGSGVGGNRISDGVDDEWRGGLRVESRRSIPEDLRTSSDSYEQAPMPSPTAMHLSLKGSQLQRTVIHSPPRNISSGMSHTPEVVYQYTDRSPDSAHMRMRFQVDFDSPRRRALSIDEGSPRKLNSHSANRPMSSPPRQIQPTTSFSPPRPLLKTSQHPHPVPLSPETAANLYDGTTYYEPSITEHRDDNVLLTGPGQAELEDGLDLLVDNTTLPHGTPGGKRRDLRLGVLSDSRPERGAVRFFSRDVYAPSSVSPDSTVPMRHSSSPPSSKASKRSSSPFEIKFSPKVTKRMSLDAFGAGLTTSATHDQASVEELEEYDDDSNGEIPVDEEVTVDDEVLADSEVAVDDEKEPAATFQHKTLSTIEEGPSFLDSETKWFTPAVPRQHDDEAIRSSPFVPPRHLSAPPTAVVDSLARGLSQPDESNKESAENTKVVLGWKHGEESAEQSVKEAEDRRIEAMLETHERVEEVSSSHQEKILLEEQLGSLQKGMASARLAHQISIQQLREAISKNEGLFDQLKEAHDNLALRCTDLETERAELLHERQRDAATLNISHDAQLELKKELEMFKDKLINQADLLAQITSLKERLQQVTAENATRQDYVSNLWLELSEKAKEVLRLEAQIKETSDAGESYISTLRAQLSKSNDENRTIQRDLQNALRQLGAKESIIGVLRDKVGRKQFELDERTVEAEMLRGQLSNEVERLESQIRNLENELAQVRKKSEELEGTVQDAELSKKNWDIERQELLGKLEVVTNADQQINNLEAQISDLHDDLGLAHEEYNTVVGDLEEARLKLDVCSNTIEEQSREIANLREMLNEDDEALARSANAATRRVNDSERAFANLTDQMTDLEIQLATNQASLERAVMDAERYKADATDVRSRLDTYLAEIDRLKLSEANLKSDLEEKRGMSASAELEHTNLTKRMAQLEQDKELLNIALESKQYELVLLQRQTGRVPGTVTPRTKERILAASSTSSGTRLAASTGKTVSRTDHEETPGSRRLTTSTSSSALRGNHARRESIVMSTPTGMQRARTPLSTSTRHNRTPEKATVRPKEVTRKSSLPVLVRRTSSVVTRTVDDVREEDEV